MEELEKQTKFKTKRNYSSVVEECIDLEEEPRRIIGKSQKLKIAIKKELKITTLLGPGARKELVDRPREFKEPEEEGVIAMNLLEEI